VKEREWTGARVAGWRWHHCGGHELRHGQPVETGTIARTYRFSAGTLAIEGGVPFGVAAAAPVTFTTAAPRNKNATAAGMERAARARVTRCEWC
jgi:hypothetical protein